MSLAAGQDVCACRRNWRCGTPLVVAEGFKITGVISISWFNYPVVHSQLYACSTLYACSKFTNMIIYISSIIKNRSCIKGNIIYISLYTLLIIDMRVDLVVHTRLVR